MSRVQPMPSSRDRAARVLVAMLAAASLALPAVARADAATDSKPAAASKPHAAKPAPKSGAAAVRSPYARAAAADAAERPHRSNTGRGQSTVQAAGHGHAKRAGAPTP